MIAAKDIDKKDQTLLHVSSSLPLEVLEQISCLLDCKSYLNFRSVSRHFLRLSSTPTLCMQQFTLFYRTRSWKVPERIHVSVKQFGDREFMDLCALWLPIEVRRVLGLKSVVISQNARRQAIQNLLDYEFEGRGGGYLAADIILAILDDEKRVPYYFTPSSFEGVYRVDVDFLDIPQFACKCCNLPLIYYVLDNWAEDDRDNEAHSYLLKEMLTFACEMELYKLIEYLIFDLNAEIRFPRRVSRVAGGDLNLLSRIIKEKKIDSTYILDSDESDNEDYGSDTDGNDTDGNDMDGNDDDSDMNEDFPPFYYCSSFK